jgi:CO dehydrogenase maturation factor
VDHLFFLSDYSLKGIRTVGRIRDLITELKLTVRGKHLVVDRAPGELAPEFLSEIERQGVKLLGAIPPDERILEYDLQGRPLLDLPEDSAAVKAVKEMVAKIFP